jgi:hypothetical protein
MVAGTERLTKGIKDEWGFTGACGARKQTHGFSVTRQLYTTYKS